MSTPLYLWPPTAKFGRVVPKTKFYERATVSAAVRKKFIADVQQITWAYKLSVETVHLPARDSVLEIQVFAIDAKGEDVNDDVLGAIDASIAFPIIFEINRGRDGEGECRMVAAYKQLGARPKVSTYFTTDWWPSDATRVPLPPAIDLPGLYAGLLKPILPIGARPGEALADTTDRIEKASKLERELMALRKRLRAEPQLNRKVEIRRQVRDRTADLASLVGPGRTMTEDA